MKDLHTLEKYRLRDMERQIFGAPGDGGNGCFKVLAGRHSFFCVASNGGGWEHVSVSPCNEKRKTCPTWEEMCEIKDLFWRPDECVVQYHPPKSDYVNRYPYCLHLWRPIGQELPRPPKEFV